MQRLWQRGIIICKFTFPPFVYFRGDSNVRNVTIRDVNPHRPTGMYFSFDIKELDVWSAMSERAIIILSRKRASEGRNRHFRGETGERCVQRGREAGSANSRDVSRAP